MSSISIRLSHWVSLTVSNRTAMTRQGPYPGMGTGLVIVDL